VRRAGFAYRRNIDAFLQHYKSLCPKTWPNYRGNPRDGVRELLEFLHISESEFRIGHSKVGVEWFISFIMYGRDAFCV
jgi:myosin-1